MSSQIVLTDIDAFISELCTNLPSGLRQLADALDAGRIDGRYVHHLAHGFAAGDRFGLTIKLRLSGKIAIAEHAPEMLASAAGVDDAKNTLARLHPAWQNLVNIWQQRQDHSDCVSCGASLLGEGTCVWPVLGVARHLHTKCKPEFRRSLDAMRIGGGAL